MLGTRRRAHSLSCSCVIFRSCLWLSPGTCTCARTGTCSEMRRLSASILAAVQWSLMTRVVRYRACQQGAFPRHEGASCPAYKPVPKRQNSRDDNARPNITSVRSSARLHHRPSRCVPERANTAGSPCVWLAWKCTSEREPTRAALVLVHASACRK